MLFRVTKLVSRTLALALLGLFAGLVTFDVTRPPERQHAAGLALAAIRTYQRYLSPPLSNLGLACRFVPTCSRYAEAAIRRHGVVDGSWLTMRRVVRCGPWTESGTVDPLP